jgi:hypothetical protein
MMISHHLTCMLLVGAPRELDGGASTLRARVQGTHAPKTTLEVVSTFDWDRVRSLATFLVPRANVQAWVAAGREIALVDCMFWRVMSKSTCRFPTLLRCTTILSALQSCRAARLSRSAMLIHGTRSARCLRRARET